MKTTPWASGTCDGRHYFLINSSWNHWSVYHKSQKSHYPIIKSWLLPKSKAKALGSPPGGWLQCLVSVRFDVWYLNRSCGVVKLLQRCITCCLNRSGSNGALHLSFYSFSQPGEREEEMAAVDQGSYNSWETSKKWVFLVEQANVPPANESHCQQEQFDLNTMNLGHFLPSLLPH